MGKTTLRVFSRLPCFSLFIFLSFFFFFWKGTKMNLASLISVLCFVAGIPAYDGVKADFKDQPLAKSKTARMLFRSALEEPRMDGANRQADERPLKDFANAEISRDTRGTCAKLYDECKQQSDCCPGSGLNCWGVRMPGAKYTCQCGFSGPCRGPDGKILPKRT